MYYYRTGRNRLTYAKNIQNKTIAMHFTIYHIPRYYEISELLLFYPHCDIEVIMLVEYNAFSHDLLSLPFTFMLLMHMEFACKSLNANPVDHK